MAEPLERGRFKATVVQSPAMPKGFLRVLAIALLGLIVPLQGMAAVVAGQCMVLGHHQDGGAGSVQDQTHGHHAGGGHGADHAQADGHGAVPDDHESGKESHCGPCTACCASASIAGTVALPNPPAPAHAKYAFLQLPPRGVQPLGLDRPPLAL
jgi:hypothetical protein